MSNQIPKINSKEKGTLKYFDTHRTITLICSFISLGVFLLMVYLTVPLFFANFWLMPILVLVLVFAKSFGSWDAYLKMRQQTDTMQRELNNIAKAVEKVSGK